jgi:hypothetical protein
VEERGLEPVGQEQVMAGGWEEEAVGTEVGSRRRSVDEREEQRRTTEVDLGIGREEGMDTSRSSVAGLGRSTMLDPPNWMVADSGRREGVGDSHTVYAAELRERERAKGERSSCSAAVAEEEAAARAEAGSSREPEVETRREWKVAATATVDAENNAKAAGCRDVEVEHCRTAYLLPSDRPQSTRRH